MSTTIRLTPEIEERIESLASRTSRSKSDYLREIIERGLEDVEDLQLAEEAAARIRRGEERVLSSEEMWRGMDD